MGIAEIIPGVSGSTIALILGVYDNFINFLHSLSSKVKHLIKWFILNLTKKSIPSKNLSYYWSKEKTEWNFGIPLILGMISINLILANIIATLFTQYPNYIQGLFFGLVIISVGIPLSQIKTKNAQIFSLIIFFAVSTFYLLGFTPTVIVNPSILILFLGGIIGIMGMILPGISGAFILLVLGIYEHIINLVKNFSRFQITLDGIVDLFFFGIGLIVGFLVFVRFVKYGFKKYPNIVLAILTGIMIGSLRAIYPFFNPILENEKMVGKQVLFPWDNSLLANPILILGFILIGSFAVFAIQKISKKRDLDIIPK